MKTISMFNASFKNFNAISGLHILLQSISYFWFEVFLFYSSDLQGITIQQYKEDSNLEEILYVSQQSLNTWRTHKHK